MGRNNISARRRQTGYQQSGNRLYRQQAETTGPRDTSTIQQATAQHDAIAQQQIKQDEEAGKCPAFLCMTKKPGRTAGRITARAWTEIDRPQNKRTNIQQAGSGTRTNIQPKPRREHRRQHRRARQQPNTRNNRQSRTESHKTALFRHPTRPNPQNYSKKPAKPGLPEPSQKTGTGQDKRR